MPKNINNYSGLKTSRKDNLKYKISSLAFIGFLFVALSLSNNAQASGFDLPVVSTSSMALANQSTALAEDASVIAFNPAGIANLNGYSANINVLNAFMDIQFKNAVSYYGKSNYRPTGMPEPQPAMVRGLTSGRMAPIYQPIPSIFSSFQVADFAYIGLGIYAPYGNTMAVKPNTVLRYTLENSAMMAIDAIPTVSFKIADSHMLGLGLIIQYFHMELSQFADISPAILITALTQVNDAYTEIQGSGPINDLKRGIVKDGVYPKVAKSVNNIFRNGTMDAHMHMNGSHIGVGVNLGYLWKINEDINLGLAYRSPIKHKLKMSVHWEPPEESKTPFAGKDYVQLAKHSAAILNIVPLGEVANIKVYYKDVIDGLLESGFVPKEKGEMAMTTPQTASIHFSYRVIPELTLMTDFTYTNYSVMKEQVMKFENVKHAFNTQPLTYAEFPSADRGNYLKSLNSNVKETILGMNWRDTFKGGIGVIYQPLEDLQVRSGFQFDSSPIRENKYRATMAPDNHRLIFGLGAKYKFLDHHSIDFAYTLLYVLPATSEWNDYCGKAVDFGEGSMSCMATYSQTKVDFNTMAHFIGLSYNFHYDTSKKQ